MSLVVITGGLSGEQLSFIEEAMSQSFGSGVVTVKEYSLNDLSLVKELRLGVGDSSVLAVYLASLEGYKALEKSRSMLEESGKFLEVSSTGVLVERLCSEFGVELDYSPVEEVSSSPIEEVGLSDEAEARYIRLLSAKDDTIQALELQLGEQRDNYENLLANLVNNNSGVSSEKLDELEERVSSLSSENESLRVELETLKEEDNSFDEELHSLRTENSSLVSKLEVIKEQKAELSSKFNSADALSRSQERLIADLKSKLAESRESEVDVKAYERRISSLESELAQSNDRVRDLSTKVSSMESESKERSRYVSELESQVSSLRSNLEEERRNVNILNRRLVSGEVSSTRSESSDDVLELPTTLEQPVWSGLWKESGSQFRNITFLFSGTGDSHREAYLYAEDMLSKNPRGGIFYDLSTESVADYRFGVKRGHEVANWYLDSNENLKKYLSKTKYSDVYVLGSFRGSINELSYYTLDLYTRLEYLDSLNISVVVYGGDISSYFGRSLMSSAVSRGSVRVVCRSLGTSARSMYYHSKLVGGSSRAKYYLVGKMDEMSKTVFKVAKKDGYDWEVLNA